MPWSDCVKALIKNKKLTKESILKLDQAFNGYDKDIINEKLAKLRQKVLSFVISFVFNSIFKWLLGSELW